MCLAAIRYNPNRGTEFSSLAYPYIVGCIKRYKRDNYLVKYPRKSIDLYGKVYKMLSEGYTEEEIIVELSISRSALAEVMAINIVSSLESEITEDGITLLDTVGYDVSFDESLIEDDILQAVDKILVKATDKVRNIYEEVIYSRLFEDEPRQKYLAEKYDMSQANISRVVRKYDKKLKEYLGWQMKV